MSIEKINIMNIKRLFTIFVFLILPGLVFAQKGVVNNGAKIIITGSAILDIEGGSEAGYTNKTSGSDHGRINLEGKIILSGNWINNASADSVFINPGSNGEVHFSGSSNQDIGGSGFTSFEKVVINNSNGITLGNDIVLYGDLSLDNGNILLGSNNLTLSTSSHITGTPSATKMIIATGGGELRKRFSGTGSFTFPIGDNSGTNEYSPAVLEFTSGAFGSFAYAGISLTDSKHANNGSLTDYLSRYWSVTQNNINGFSCNVTFTYLDDDINGTESNIYGGQWENPNWIKLNTANTTNNQLTGTVNNFSDFTGGESSEFSISVSMTDDGEITEGSEDGEVITVTLTGGTFVDPLTTGNWFLTNLPDGITKGALVRTDATHATIALSGNRTTDYDSDITNLILSINTDEVNDTSGADITTNTGVTFVANDESVTISHTGLDENNLNGAVIGIKLANKTFTDATLVLANFTINNVPLGTTKNIISYEGADTATITLAFDGTDFDTDITNFSITIDASELAYGSDITSNYLVITAVVEPGTLTISHTGLTEENLDEAVIGLALTEVTFIDATLNPDNFTLNNAPAGTGVDTVIYLDSTHATLAVEFDGTVFNDTIYDFSITIGSIELTGLDDLESNDLVISPVTGISPYPEALGINMYSFENRIFIECSDPEKLKEVAIYNILGSELIRRKLDKNPVNEIRLDTPGNYYIIRVYTTDNKIYNKKLLIYLR